MKKIFLISVLATMSVNADWTDNQNNLLKTTLEGRECTVHDSEARGCNFKLGSDVHFEIVGVGLKDSAVLIHQAKRFQDADYYIMFGGVHGCIIVGGPEMSHVFVHPQTAEVHKEYVNCWPNETMREMQIWQGNDIQESLRDSK
jgi:hypothetical protein